jgi:hypothetical protein
MTTIISRFRGVTIDGVLMNNLLTTPLGTTSSYSATANLHTLQITVANTKSSPTYSAFNNRSLAVASNTGNFSASRAQVLSAPRISRN